MTFLEYIFFLDVHVTQQHIDVLQIPFITASMITA